MVVAFEESRGFFKQLADFLDKVLTLLFTADIFINFNLALYKDETILIDRGQIATEYFRRLFWIDLVGVFPFAWVASLCAGFLEASYKSTLMLSLFRLLQIVRTRRLAKFADDLRYDARVGLLMYTLIRDFMVVVISCHFQACVMYFLARYNHFDDSTWLGPKVHHNESSLEAYVTSFYMCVTTFCTVGYGDFSPKNTMEKSFGSFFMLLNIAIAAWIIGSITLLVIKGDEVSREYRDSLNVLHIYGTMHNFEGTLLDRLKRQLRLDFNNREVADDQVLRHFPSQVRRKIMRRLYHDHLINSKLMTGIRPQFVDAFLASCTVEIFSPGEEIVERGSIVSDLYLLVGGIAEITCSSNFSENVQHISKLDAGNFIGEIGFFTESPVLHTVVSVTVCKTLTLSRQSYQMLAQDHPGSAGKILHNLLQKVENESIQVDLPKPLHALRLGSVYENDLSMHHPTPSFQMGHESLTAVKDLVKMHMRRRRDDDTTKLLFAASRGDTKTIFLMCGHGFNPNNTDYDRRTALMVASMKGNADAVKLLLKYNARPNEIDMNGSTALFEAAKSGNEQVEELLLNAGAELCMQDCQAASVLCQTVYDGNIMLLKRLVKAGINVNAADYDRRTAAHIAAAEGNVAAIRILVEGGADLTLPDRWGNTVGIEARRSNSEQILELLDRSSVDTTNDIENNIIL
ncbi:hypothetical protein ACHAXA_002452 [Cyclostephanos tholiformis]|uniref:Cyclic nucleotide-binding domain-containing protein n=1 Tax=Cyclostephanos tholiformis TaxID=382380 RepID=A0ABD3RC88_9STRA